MRTNSLSFVLISCLAVGSALPAFGQTSSPSSTITVTTDKPSYSNGDQIVISGTVGSKLNVPISIVIKDSSQNLVEIGQVTVNADNTYSTQLIAGGRLWAAVGTYEIDVTYGSAANTAKITFAYTGSVGTSSNMTGASGNQTIPEFGQVTFIVLAISMISLVFYMRIRSNFRMP